MTDQNGDSKQKSEFQQLWEHLNLRDQAIEGRPPEQQLQVIRIAEAEGIEPGEPMWKLFEALGIIQDLVVEAPERLKAASNEAVTEMLGKVTQQKLDIGLNDAQMDKLRRQLRKALIQIADTYQKENTRDYAMQWLALSITAMILWMLGGGIVGYWMSESRSAEARRYWEWNQNLIAECQKQKLKTCNIHVVPPEQW